MTSFIRSHLVGTYLDKNGLVSDEYSDFSISNENSTGVGVMKLRALAMIMGICR